MEFPKIPINQAPPTRQSPSVASRASSRVKTFELDAGIFGRELPVDFGLQVVAAGLPGSDLGAHRLDAVDAPVQALADHDVDFGVTSGKGLQRTFNHEQHFYGWNDDLLSIENGSFLAVTKVCRATHPSSHMLVHESGR